MWGGLVQIKPDPQLTFLNLHYFVIPASSLLQSSVNKAEPPPSPLYLT